jgi:3-oxoacyl-[acyl-carrier-protein] synthase-3
VKVQFSGKRISGLRTVLPETELRFDDEVDNYTFPPKQTLRLKAVMGYETHRVVKPSTATSDLLWFGLKGLLDEGLLRREDIGALVAVTITPDHLLPHVGSALHGLAELPEDTIVVDLVQGCTAFLHGLMQAFLLLDRLPAGKKVVVAVGDTLSKWVSTRDRNSYPLIGDAGSIVVVENGGDDTIRVDLRNDGSRRDSLRIPAGGSRLASSVETAELVDSGDGNLRSLDNLVMDGSAVFTFVQTDVPPLIDSALAGAGLEKDDVDYFLFHQPNKFMLRKLSEKLGIAYDKVPMNVVEKYGNPSGASIPLVIADNLSEQMRGEALQCCLSAFGSGLSWGAITMKLGGMDFCDLVVSDL